MMGELSFSPCGRRGREAADERALRDSARSSVSPAASHLLPQGEKGGTAIVENWQARFAQALENPALPPPQLFADCDLPARFAVYRNNCAVAAIGALKAQFPTLALLVGDEAFAGLARLFIQKFPPRSPVLGEYGAQFHAFLETFPGIGATPYLPDSARLDWACLKARRAPEAEPFGAARLAELDAARIGEQRVRLHPSLALVASNWPILAIAQVHETPVREWRGETALVMRPAAELVVKPCPPGAATFLRACLEGKTLGEAARRAGESDETFDFGQTLVELTLIGAIIDFTEQEVEPE
ncbi:DNA-binding domain-containing protein [uncultured Rhodoblastus sp.]|uniref:DNA-binding domain-containing protein n=1 Tax=uncultured Rhodoblastus sp. TaxID=543037 RepID=UPI00314528BE